MKTLSKRHLYFTAENLANLKKKFSEKQFLRNQKKLQNIVNNIDNTILATGKQDYISIGNLVKTRWQAIFDILTCGGGYYKITTINKFLAEIMTWNIDDANSGYSRGRFIFCNVDYN
jgi:methyltransferase-like protein